MLQLEERIDLLERLGHYIQTDGESWQQAKRQAAQRNAWFNEDSINMAADGIATQFLHPKLLKNWIASYKQPTAPKRIGLIMAGNIPLVGFHDFLCGFVAGHILHIKLSSKDDVLLKHLGEKLIEWQPVLAESILFVDNLKGCDAYIATGSNNTARYFEQYFGKYPNIIRKNRTSVAILNGEETTEDLNELGKDIFSYYGLGCRNVTKIYLPTNYDVTKLLSGLDTYKDIIHQNKYKNNYDYFLAIYLLNRVPYYDNGFLLMVENPVPFSAVSVLHYEFYSNYRELLQNLSSDENIQCIVDNSHVKFGNSQFPSLTDYADGVDTMMFLSEL